MSFQILFIITLVFLASRDSLSTHFKAEHIHFHMNGVSDGIDLLLGHSKKRKESVYSYLGHPVEVFDIFTENFTFHSQRTEFIILVLGQNSKT